MGTLAYKIDFPDYWCIYLVILVAHLEPAFTNKNLYQWSQSEKPDAVIIAGYKKFEVEKLIRKRIMLIGIVHYLIR